MGTTRLFASVLLICFFTACAESPQTAEPRETPPNTTVNLPDQPAGDDAGTEDSVRDDPFGLGDGLASQPLTPGQWRRAEAKAQFAEARTEPRLSVVCDQQNDEVVLYRAGELGPNEQLRLGIFTEAGNTAGYWRFADSGLPQMVSRLPAAADVWSKVAAAERFGVGTEGRTLLILPVAEPILETLEVCGAQSATEAMPENRLSNSLIGTFDQTQEACSSGTFTKLTVTQDKLQFYYGYAEIESVALRDGGYDIDATFFQQEGAVEVRPEAATYRIEPSDQQDDGIWFENNLTGQPPSLLVRCDEP